MSAGDGDEHRLLVRRLARKTGLRSHGPAGTFLLPTCEYPTVDSGGRDQECGRIATHNAWFPDKPSGPRDYCAHHAVEAAGYGETFEPTFWLSEVGKDYRADLAGRGREPRRRCNLGGRGSDDLAPDGAPSRGLSGPSPKEADGGSDAEIDPD